MTGRASTGIVKLRKVKNNMRKGEKGYDTFQLTVPMMIARHIEHLMGASFLCELTEEGILFKPLAIAQSVTDVPDWAQA